MKCDNCKEREAKIHFTSVINGVVEECHLCEICAVGIKNNIYEHFPVHKLFESFNVDKICSNCGLSYDKFKSTGKLGCSNCYDAFGEELSYTIRGIHGHTKHIGKVLKRGSERFSDLDDIKILDEKLREAIKLEEYEKAAVLRDEINKIKDTIDLDKRGERDE